MGFWMWLSVIVVAYLVYAVVGLVYCNVKMRANLSESGKPQLDKNSLLYKHCFGRTFPFPKKISTCMVGRYFLLMPIFYLVISAVFVSVFGILYPLGFVIGFFFAYHPPITKKEFDEVLNYMNNEFPVVHYKHWPKWRGHKIWPISVIGVLAVLYLVGMAGYYGPAWVLILIAVSILVVFAVTCLSILLFNGNNWKAMRQWFKDWKKQVCKEVEITGGD